VSDFFLAALRKDFLARLKDPMSLLMWFGIPVILGGLMSLAFGGTSGPSPKAVVWLADEDDSTISQLLVGALDNPNMPVVIELVDFETASARIESGEGSAAIRIPSGFGQAFLEESPTSLEVVTNPSQTILPGIVTGSLELLSEAHFYLHRLGGEPLKRMVSGPSGGNLFTDPELIAMTLEINNLVRDLQDKLFPPQIQLATQPIAETSSQPFSFGTQLLPGILLMALMFMAQGLADELWSEREQGTLARTLTGPVSTLALLASKLAGAALLMALTALIGLGFGIWAFGLSAASLPAAMLWCTLSGCTLFLMFTWLTNLASTRRAASLIGNLVLFPLVMLGGSFFPFSSMPSGMASLGRMTPNGRAVEGLGVLLEGGALSSLGTGALVLVASGALFWLLASKRLTRSLVH